MAPIAGAADDTLSIASSSSSSANPPPAKRSKTTQSSRTRSRPLIEKRNTDAALKAENLWPSAYNRLKGAPKSAPAYLWTHPAEDASVSAFIKTSLGDLYSD